MSGHKDKAVRAAVLMAQKVSDAMTHSKEEKERECERHRVELAEQRSRFLADLQSERARHMAELQEERARHLKEHQEHLDEQQQVLDQHIREHHKAMEGQRAERGEAAEMIRSLEEEVSRLRGAHEAVCGELEEERRQRKQLERALEACTVQLSKSRDDVKRCEKVIAEHKVVIAEQKEEAARRQETAKRNCGRMEGEASELRVAVAVREDKLEVKNPSLCDGADFRYKSGSILASLAMPRLVGLKFHFSFCSMPRLDGSKLGLVCYSRGMTVVSDGGF